MDKKHQMSALDSALGFLIRMYCMQSHAEPCRAKSSLLLFHQPSSQKGQALLRRYLHAAWRYQRSCSVAQMTPCSCDFHEIPSSLLARKQLVTDDDRHPKALMSHFSRCHVTSWNCRPIKIRAWGCQVMIQTGPNGEDPVIEAGSLHHSQSQSLNLLVPHLLVRTSLSRGFSVALLDRTWRM